MILALGTTVIVPAFGYFLDVQDSNYHLLFLLGAVLSLISAVAFVKIHFYYKRFGGDEKQVEKMLAMEGKTKDDLAKDWEGEALRAVKSQIIIAQISKAEKIDATDEDIEEEIKTEAGRSGMKIEEFKEYVKENNMNEYLFSDRFRKNPAGRNSVRKDPFRICLFLLILFSCAGQVNGGQEESD